MTITKPTQSPATAATKTRRPRRRLNTPDFRHAIFSVKKEGKYRFQRGVLEHMQRIMSVIGREYMRQCMEIRGDSGTINRKMGEVALFLGKVSHPYLKRIHRQGLACVEASQRNKASKQKQARTNKSKKK